MGMFLELSLVVRWQGNIYIAEASAMSKTNVRLLTPAWMMDNRAEKCIHLQYVHLSSTSWQRSRAARAAPAAEVVPSEP